MSAISAQDVNKLRQMTGAGMMDCKKHLPKPKETLIKLLRSFERKVRKYLLRVLIEKQKKDLFS